MREAKEALRDIEDRRVAEDQKLAEATKRTAELSGVNMCDGNGDLRASKPYMHALYPLPFPQVNPGASRRPWSSSGPNQRPLTSPSHQPPKLRKDLIRR